MCSTAVSSPTGAGKSCRRTTPEAGRFGGSLRGARRFRPFAHHRQKLADLTAVTLDHRGKFRALRHQHADTIDDYVVNLEGTVVVDEPPINFDRRLAFRADDIRRDDGSTSSVRLPRTLNVSPLKLESRVP